MNCLRVCIFMVYFPWQRESFTTCVLFLLNNCINASCLFGGYSGHLAKTIVKRKQADYFRVEHILISIHISCHVPTWPKSEEKLRQCNLGTHSTHATVLNHAARTAGSSLNMTLDSTSQGTRQVYTVISPSSKQCNWKCPSVPRPGS